jgi:hypothetical protein
VAAFSNFSASFSDSFRNAAKRLHLTDQVGVDLRAVFDSCCAFAAKAGVVS